MTKRINLMLSLYILVTISACLPTTRCLDNSKLARAGIISSAEYAVSVYAQTNEAYIALRTIPYLPANPNNCFTPTITTYNTTIQSIFSPIVSQINAITSSTSTQQERLFGVIIGTVALGVATAAQVTAAVALTQAQSNAKAILQLKSSIQNTIAAVSEVKDGLSTIGIALGKIQVYVNEVINPQLANLTCQTAAANLGVQLSLYLTELATVFGPQITNPALSPLTIQALYNLAGSNLDTFFEKYGYKQATATSVLEAGLVTGQIVSFDPATGIGIIRVSLPSIATLSSARVTKLETVSVSTSTGEAVAIVPSFIIQQGTVIEEFIIDGCIRTSADIYCTRLFTKILPDSVLNCLQGLVNECQFTRGLGTYANRFVTINGGIVANCQTLLCRCYSPSYIITQNSNIAVTLIDSSTCRDLDLDGIRLALGNTEFSEYAKNLTIAESQFAPSDALDISSEIGKLNATISRVEDYLNQATKDVTAISINKSAADIILIVTLILTILLIITVIVIVVIIIKQRRVITHKTTNEDMISNPYVTNAK
uniref:Fusion glycoprotein F0 n=1 Tax=Avian metaavulavirus 21 TaxID=2613793 RepID=A0A5J6CUX9_9MONO|nr:fusion protein [Avian metaavulavirus 21]